MKVDYIDHMGSDLTVANAARVSMGKWKDQLDEADEKLIRYLARNSHWCYDDQTEILTNKGWKLFDDLVSEDLVAQVSGWEDESWSMTFVQPTKKHKSFYSGPMFLCETSTVNYCVTPGHRMLFQKKMVYGYSEWRIEASEEIGTFPRRFRTTATLLQDGYGSFEEGWLYGFLLADGFRVSTNQIWVRLKRPRKIAALTNFLTILRKEFSVSVSFGVTAFNIVDSDMDLASCVNKELPDFAGKSSYYLQGMLEGYLFGDGSVKHKGWEFTSSSKKLFDGICHLAALCGYQASVGLPRHVNTNPNHNINYRGIILSRHTGTINKGPVKDEQTANYAGFVHCVTVPSGMVMTRRKGVQLVCGNTPFGQPQIQLRLTVPILVARQAHRSTVGTVRNEISRRYVDDAPEFFVPEEWRSRPEKSIKQGSGEPLPMHLVWKADALYTNSLSKAAEAYTALLELGVAPEQARMVLPQSMMTSWVETGSLAYWWRFYSLRSDSHAQREIRDLAALIKEQVQPLFPICWAALESAGGVE